MAIKYVDVDSYPALREYVAHPGGGHGLFKLTMGELRDIEQAGRLGKHVRDRISLSLRQHGLGHLPVELPNDQSEEVRIYLLGSEISQAIDAVLRPSSTGDTLLRNLSRPGASKKLSEVRTALEELIETLDD